MILTQHCSMSTNQSLNPTHLHHQQKGTIRVKGTDIGLPQGSQISPKRSKHTQRLLDSDSDTSVLSVMNGYRKRRATSPAYRTTNNINHIDLQGYHSDNTSSPHAHDWDSVLEHSSNGHQHQTGPYTMIDPDTPHVIKLSGIEHCMPRAYIRVCLAYRVEDPDQIQPGVRRLNTFIRKIVNAKPYLAGHVLPKGPNRHTAEIRFTNKEYEYYPEVEVGELLDSNNKLVEYDELAALGFPPSRLHPDKVAKLPERKADEKQAPALGVRANIVKGGLVISLYLHHFISDGMGLGLLLSGSVTDDPFTFDRHPKGHTHQDTPLWRRLNDFAVEKTRVRKQLTCGLTAQSTHSRIMKYNRRGVDAMSNKPGRGCVFSIPDKTVESLRDTLSQYFDGPRFSKHDALQAFIWRHMSKARMSEVSKCPEITTTKLQVPVNIRNKITPNLADCYFGAAVDFATAELDLSLITQDDSKSLAVAANVIRTAIQKIDEPYIRQAIALAMSPDPVIDTEDLMGANMNRVTGADMYITSWERLPLYEATLDMGLGRPEWVRKPWSRDPGSCIILPRNSNKPQYEIVIQLKADDMARLLDNKVFMGMVTGFTE